MHWKCIMRNMHVIPDASQTSYVPYTPAALAALGTPAALNARNAKSRTGKPYPAAMRGQTTLLAPNASLMRVV